MSKQVWREIWKTIDTSYNQKRTISQWDMFERMKIRYLNKIFPEVSNDAKEIRSLECGCGGATVSVYFSQKGYKAIAFDYELEALRVAKSNFEKEESKANLLCADVENIPLKNDTFDIVMSFGLIEHFKDVRRQINEMARVLKPGGIFFLDISPNGYHLKNKSIQCENISRFFNFTVSFIYHFFKLGFSLKRAYKKASLVFFPEYYENQLSLEDYERIAKSAGIKNLSCRGNRPFPRLYLPGFLDTLYLAILRFCEPLWGMFDSSNSRFCKNWGAGWWLYGKK